MLSTQHLDHIGIAIDPSKNVLKSSVQRDISSIGATIKTLVIPTNEEYEIARQAYALVNEAI